jgi:outer membrane protein TolC
MRRVRPNTTALSVLLLVAGVAGCATSHRADVDPSSAITAAPLSAGSPGAAPSPAPLPDLGAAAPMEALLPLLLERNPRIRSARARLEAAAERYPQAIALKDPMVEATWYAKNAMDPDDTFTRYNLMVRQEFPFPTVLVLRGDAATKEAEAEALRYEATVRDAVTELKDIQAERAYLARTEAVQSAIRDIYRRYADLARGGIGAGRTRLPESFRAEALLAQAGYELTLIAELRTVEDQRLRALLSLPRAVSIAAPDAGPAPMPLDLDVEELSRRALARNQEIRAAGIEAEGAGIGVRLARWEYAPMFTLGAGKMVNDDYDPASGMKEDSNVVSLGLTIPIWAGAKSAAVREAEARERAALSAESGERERVAADVARLAFRVRNASRLAVLYGRELVPQAEKALLRSQAMVQEGKESMSSSLELAATWQQLRIAEIRAQADLEQAMAALERVLGTSLEAVPEDSEQEPRR